MIDGFGWFEKGNYRRTWLLFDNVDYLFPRDVAKDVFFRGLIPSQPYLYKPVQVGVDDAAERLDTLAVRESADKTIQSIVASIPQNDLSYAQNVVTHDLELGPLLSGRRADLVLPLSLLSSKLLLYAGRTGTIPVVGRDYAWKLLSRKLELLADDSVHESLRPGVLPTARQKVVHAAFAAGLSLHFLADEALEEIDFDALVRFKKDQEQALERHQIQIAETAQKFAGLPEGPEFLEALGALRLHAEQQRRTLDEEVKEAWLGMGFNLAKKAIAVAGAAALPALAVVLNAPIETIVGAALPATFAAGAAVASEALTAADQSRKAQRVSMSYILNANSLLAAAP